MRRLGLAVIVAAAGIGGTAVITTTHAAGLPLPLPNLGGSGLPVVGSLPGLGGGASDPVSGVLGAVTGIPGYALNCGLMANVPVMQHPTPAHKAKSKKTKKHTSPALPDCGAGLPVVGTLPVVGPALGGLPTSGLGGLTGGLPGLGGGGGLGGLAGGLPIGGLAGGLPISGLMGGLPIGGLTGGLPIGGLAGGLPGLGGLLGG
jgi:hypothetical protein